MSITSFLPVASASAAYGVLEVALSGLEPRHILDRPPALARRDALCGQGYHNCLDIGRGDQCCDNESYCYIDKSSAVQCCPIGSNCVDDSYCKSDSFFCRGRATVQGAVETSHAGCCRRRCPQTSQFLCPQSLGGKCCPYVAECRAGGSCVEMETAPTTSAPVTTRNAASGPGDGCSASQYRCADGTGCCNDGQRCTKLSGTAYCAASSSPPRDAGARAGVSASSSPGLSSRAKAAMGATVALAAAFILGAVAWLCVLQRRRRRRCRAAAPAPRSTSPAPDAGSTEMRGPSEATPTPRLRPGRGLTEEYSGPSPVAGPYTDAATLDELRMSLPGLARAVPSHPDRPGDIVAPVEMDSFATPDRPTPEDRSLHAAQPSSQPATPGPFELYGSEAYPCPPPSSHHLLEPLANDESQSQRT